ncbi:MAG TPA: TRAP transporter substrate-binding protein DctP [Burkholderiaceae bacterium]|nr:TRAP transporter substrate-binding protein DctP [Burkholderiaceae bacterium]
MTTHPIRSLLARILVPVLLACWAAAAAHAQTFTLRYGHTTAATNDSDDHIAALWLQEFLERKSGGRVKVEIFPASQLGDFRQMLEQVQLGTLEMTQTTVGGIASFFPEIQVTDLPYLMPSDEVAERVARGPFFDKVREEVLRRMRTVRLIAVANSGNWRSFFTTKPVKSPAELKGLKIRSIDSPLHIEFMKALGINPTPVPWGELYTAASTGVVDGTNNSAADVMRFKLGEVMKHVILDEHMLLTGFFWINDNWLKKLPPDLQDLVVDGVRQAASIQARFNEQVESTYRTQFVKAGGTVVTVKKEQRADFFKARDAARSWFIKQYGETWVKDYEQAIAEAQRQISVEDSRVLGRK